MGTKVNQKAKVLEDIKTNANASNSVPSLRAVVANLVDENQKMKNALVKAGLLEDD